MGGHVREESKGRAACAVHLAGGLLLRADPGQQRKGADEGPAELRSGDLAERPVRPLQFKLNHACVGTEPEPAVNQSPGQGARGASVRPAGVGGGERKQRDAEPSGAAAGEPAGAEQLSREGCVGAAAIE